MQRKFILVAFFVFLSGGTLLAQVNNGANKTIWKTYYDSLYNFSFQYPDNWEFKFPTDKSRFFVTSYKENEADSFRENVNCIARKFDQQGFVIKDAEIAIKKSLSEKLEDYKLISSDYVQWNKVDALQLKYTCTKESGDQRFSIMMFQQMAVVKGTLYTLTYTSEVAGFDKYISAVNKMYASLKVN